MIFVPVLTTVVVVVIVVIYVIVGIVTVVAVAVGDGGLLVLLFSVRLEAEIGELSCMVQGRVKRVVFFAQILLQEYLHWTYQRSGSLQRSLRGPWWIIKWK